MASSLQGTVDYARPLHGRSRRRIRHGVVPAAAQPCILLPPRWSMRHRYVLFGDVAVVRSIVTVLILSGGQTSTSTDRATEVFVHQQGSWVNPFWHTAPPG